jgi:putative aminopeptidase FrvX
MTPRKPANEKPIRIGATQIRLLERLCNACAISGGEEEVRAIILQEVRQHASEVKVDALGNVLVRCRGEDQAKGQPKDNQRLRVMLAAHMDEVGFMLTQDEGNGFFRFDTVGGLDERQLAGKAVWIGKKHVPGVIGTTPIHLTKAEERKKVIKLDSLHIDVGPGSNSKVKIGERATFATRFSRLGVSLRAKALDDRLGVVTLIELVKNPPTNLDLWVAFTVQEEVGLRGARVAAFALDPDVAIAVDSTPANDLPPWDQGESRALENARYNTRLGAGPAIYLADRSTLSDPRLIRHLVETAENLKIPYQFRQPGGGGTDAGAIHLARAGIPSVSVSIPGRYPHTAAGIARISDWQNTLNLLHAALRSMSSDLLANPR